MSDLSLLATHASQSLSEAELHGVVCGMGVVGEGPLALDQLIDLVGADALTDQNQVGAFVEAALVALNAEDLSFTLLLPDVEDVGVAERLEALAMWSASFLAGLGSVLGNIGEAELDEDTRELMRDFAAIANLETDLVFDDDDQGVDDAERELLELEEYVKVGVLLLLSSL